MAKKSKDEQNARFAQLSATVAGIADVKQVIKIASNELQMYKRKTILFIDEIHRFNKVQQVSNYFVIHALEPACLSNSQAG